MSEMTSGGRDNGTRYHERWWNHHGRLVWTPTSEEWVQMYRTSHRIDDHDSGDEDRRELDVAVAAIASHRLVVRKDADPGDEDEGEK